MGIYGVMVSAQSQTTTSVPTREMEFDTRLDGMPKHFAADGDIVMSHPLAETLLNDPEARAAIGHDGVRYLLMWHALEESEHKAVAFDVYKRMGGTERMRVATMWIVHLTFVLETSIWAGISMAMDGAAR